MILMTEFQKLQWKAIVALARFVLQQKHPWMDMTAFREEDENVLFEVLTEAEHDQRKESGK